VLATEAAIAAMRQGGNAIDAAVSAAAVSTVAQPFTSSVGGVGWASVYRPQAGQTQALAEVLQFLGSVPVGLNPSCFKPNTLGLIDWQALERDRSPLLGCLTPSAVAGWEEMLARHGTWTLDRALEPAIVCAHEGVPVSELLFRNTGYSVNRLRRWPESAAIFLDGGQPRAVGSLLIQHDLGSTLERIATNGSSELVDGMTAKAIIELHEHFGGCMTRDDLERVRPLWRPPLTTRFRGRTMHVAPAPFGDVAFVEALQVLDRFEPFSSPLDPDYVHVSIESAKLVAADRARYLGAETDDATIEWMTSATHCGELKEMITDDVLRGRTSGQVNEDTITLATVDEMGNAVHLMQTVGTFFGTGAVAPGTGVLMNSSLYFAYADQSRTNRIVPGQTVEQNPCISMAFDATGRLELIAGSPGGKTRVETVRQLLLNVFDFDMNVQQAVDAGRFLSSPDGRSVDFETRYGDVAPGLRSELERRGHVVLTKDEAFGSGQAIAIDPLSGMRMAAADWRRESVAQAY